MLTRKKHIESLEHIAEDVDVAEGNNHRNGGEEKEAGGFRELPLQVGKDSYQQQVSRPGGGVNVVQRTVKRSWKRLWKWDMG